jgi:hypothetical protein
MYREHPKKNRIIEINGINVNLPPVGQLYNVITNKWESREVLKRSAAQQYQYWERPAPPIDYDLKRKKEINAQKSNPDYYNPELQNYRNQEWDRRLNGFWFYNNGKATYLTGLHYFYLTHWKIDVGYPDYRQTDRDFFYFLEYCMQDPRSLGMIEVTKRRQGKTMRAGAFLFELTSRSKNKNAGIQSKTYEDAKDNVFAKGVVMPFKYLPDFFVPIYDTEKGMTPKGELRFYKTNKRGATDDAFDKKIELESSITFKSADKFAYDGMKLHRYLADEAGKTKNVNVYDRHQVVQFCLQQEEHIIGKALYTTTVEEMEDGGASFKELWQASDQTKRNANGRTKSGLYQYFMPAYRTLFYDKYGVADEEKAKQFYLAERAALEDDPRALASFIRKNPFTIEEAFFSEAESCLFDAMAINRQIETITWIDKKELYLRGEFVWEKGERDSRVVFNETKNGKFLVHSKANVKDTSSYNLVQEYGTKKVPKANNKYSIGVDPFDHSITVSKDRSDGAAYVYRRFDALDPLSETFLVEYINRPDKAEIFYEDMIKLCHFFGCEILAEDQKVGLIKYFEYRGYERFLMRMPGAHKFGISASSKIHQQIAEEIESYVTDNVSKVMFQHLLEDWLRFDINKTTKFDATMGSGYTLIAASNSKFAQKVEQKQTIYDIRDVFPF